MPKTQNTAMQQQTSSPQRHRNMRSRWKEVIEEGQDLSDVPFTVLLDAVRWYNRPERNLTLGDVLMEIGRRQGVALRVEHEQK